MKRYKVEFTNGHWAEGPLEDWLNRRAEEGKRLVSCAWVDRGDASGVMDLAFIFEKASDELEGKGE